MSEKQYERGFAAGVIEMISEAAMNLNPSRMTALWFSPEDFEGSFSEETGLELSELLAEDVQTPLMDFIVGYFGEDHRSMQETFSLVKMLRKCYGDELRIAVPAEASMQRLCEAFSKSRGGKGRYEQIENIFTVFFERAVLFFSVGSND